jgi:rhodanese-related sulfurtransferase
VKTRYSLASIPLLVVGGTILFCQGHRNAVSVEEAHQLIARDSTIIVLDVRTPEEYTGPLGHIDKSVLIPVQELEKRLGELEQYKDKRILAICRTGRRSATATDLLTKHGFDAYNVEGGMQQWNEKGLPVVKQR